VAHTTDLSDTSVYWQGSNADFGLELQTMANYKKSTTPDLLRIFAKAAAEQGEALRAADPKRANSRYRTMEKVYAELTARGPEAQRIILSLFEHPDGYVRLNAAAYSLDFDPPGALRVLEVVDKMESGLLGFTAGMVVKEWNKKHAVQDSKTAQN
jgi:Domain of unknown function (DUF2019)